MTIDELKFELGIVLAEEEILNWEQVEALSERIYVRLTTELDTLLDYPREDVIEYLAGFMRRRADERFGSQQRQWLRRYLRDDTAV